MILDWELYYNLALTTEKQEHIQKRRATLQGLIICG